MSHVILQPTGNSDARKHYVDTIIKPVDLKGIKQFLSMEEFSFLKEIYPNGMLPIWGVTAGVKNVNQKKWDKIQSGDFTFFSADRLLYSSGIVTFKLHNKSLADFLWGYNTKGETWEYIYFLDEIREHDIPVALFNQIVGYSENNIIQGFSVLNEEKSYPLINYFDLESTTISQTVTENEYYKIVDSLSSDPLDKEGKVKSRAEQGFLRKTLFGSKTIDKCGICGKDYPISFLVTAHIKKRAFCSNEERLDYKSIVMPMCKFGCDDLFEKGYIIIVDGKVTISEKATTNCLDEYMSNIKGREIRNWNEDSLKYFQWHAKYHSLSKSR